MDYTLTDDQRAILEGIEALLASHAGAAHAIELNKKGEYDGALAAALAEADFLGMALGPETGPLEAALLVEAVAYSAGVASTAAEALVAPGVTGRLLPGPVALARRAGSALVRFGPHARSLLVDDGDQARCVELAPGDVEPVRSNFGYPIGRVRASALEGGQSLGPGSGARLRDWWRLALAVEAAGTMRAALDCTVAYLKQRKQFGRPIGSFQAVQHRLAECSILIQGSRWLALEAAYLHAPAEAAATAAAHAIASARQVFAETHQLSGAIGFTHEHHLHVWTTRLQALKLELDGAAGHQRALAQTRWGAPP